VKQKYLRFSFLYCRNRKRAFLLRNWDICKR